MTVILRPEATVLLAGEEFTTHDGRVILDESWAPYCTAELNAPAEDPLAAMEIDPRTIQRALITASVDETLSRTFDLVLRHRDVDPETGAITLSLASDETLAQDWAPLADDPTPRNYETSLRQVCEYVLGKVFGTPTPITAPVADANVTAYWEVSNLITNPSFEADLTGWTVNAAANAPTRDTTQQVDGTASMSWTSTSTAESSVTYTNISVSPGRRYVVAGSLRTVNGRNVRIIARWRNQAGTQISDLTTGSQTTIANQWKRIDASGVAPVGATQMQLIVTFTPGAASERVFTDGIMFYEGDELVPFFTGATPPSTTYTYSWSAGSHASISTRTPVVDRPPELFIWKAGMNAWDFMQPLLESADRRLFCDEDRIWRLVAPEYVVAAIVPLTAARTLEAVDRISRDPDSPWAQGVVVRYLWDSPKLGPQERIDAAGVPGKVYLVEYRRAYPGKGAAAAILRSIKSRGRTQDVVALTDYLTTPGMTSHIAISTGVLVGRVQSVEFNLRTADMTIATREQASLTSGMIDALVGTIDGLVGTIDALTAA